MSHFFGLLFSVPPLTVVLYSSSHVIHLGYSTSLPSVVFHSTFNGFFCPHFLLLSISDGFCSASTLVHLYFTLLYSFNFSRFCYIWPACVIFTFLFEYSTHICTESLYIVSWAYLQAQPLRGVGAHTLYACLFIRSVVCLPSFTLPFSFTSCFGHRVFQFLSFPPLMADLCSSATRVY